jgi:serine protease Do
MTHFSRLVSNASSVAALNSLIGVVILAPVACTAQLIGVVPQPSVLMVHSSQGYLGIEMRDIDNDRAGALKLKDAAGAEVTYVDHDAPAGKVGLRIHDVILQMNGQQVQGVEQLRRMLRETPAGRNVALVIWRDGQQQTLNVQLADRAKIEQDAWSQIHTVPDPDDDSTITLVGPSGHGAGNGFFGSFTIGTPTVGLDLDPLGSQLADYFGIKDGQGLLVKHVAENSPAASAGLKAGDVITKVNGESMPTLNTWAKAIHANRGKPVQITIVRNRKEQILTMQAGDTKHKGELVMPGFDWYNDRSQLEEGLNQLDAQLNQIDPALLALEEQKAINSIDAAVLADQAPQAAERLNTPELQKQMRDAQQLFRRQMENNMPVIRIRPLD